MNEDRNAFALPAETAVGSVGLRVGAIDRVAPLYRDILGFDCERDGERLTLRAGDVTVLELQEMPDAPGRGSREAGLFHAAIRVPDREALADALSRIRSSDTRLSGASDHRVSEALYLQDPEGNGIEIYRDRPQSAWPRDEDGLVEMDTLPLDLDDLLSKTTGSDRFPDGTDIGHVHLEVTDLPRAETFYTTDLGLGVQARYGDGAVFLAAGEYHHHVGLNTWNGRTEPSGRGRGLAWFGLIAPSPEVLATLRSRLTDRGHTVESSDEGLVVHDPDGIQIRLSDARS